MTSNLIIPILFVVAGLVLWACGLYLFFRQRARIAQSLLVEGVVIDLLRQRSRREYLRVNTVQSVEIQKKYLYRLEVRFQTQAGRTIEFSPSLAMRPAPYQVGDVVPVLYDPKNPQQAQINRFAYLWFSVILLLFFGLFAIGMGLFGVMMQAAL